MPKADGGIDVISQANLFEVQRWWESDAWFTTSFNNANTELFNSNITNRTNFATSVLQSIARQQRQRQIRNLPQLLAAIAYTTSNNQTVELKNALEYLVQTPIAQEDDKGLWEFLRILFEWQADFANIKLEDKCQQLFPAAFFPAINGIAISAVSKLAIEKLSRLLFQTEKLLDTLKACPQFLACCPADLLFTMAKDNVEVAAYLLKQKYLVQKFDNDANRANLYTLITKVATPAWKDGSELSKNCRQAIYDLWNHSPRLFLDEIEDKSRIFDGIITRKIRTPALQEISNKLSIFFKKENIHQTLLNIPSFCKALTADDLYRLATIDYDAARFIFSHPVYSKRLDESQKKLSQEYRNKYDRWIKDGKQEGQGPTEFIYTHAMLLAYPKSLYFSHLVIVSPATRFLKKTYRHLNTEYDNLTGALEVLNNIKSLLTTLNGEDQSKINEARQKLAEIKTRFDDLNQKISRREIFTIPEANEYYRLNKVQGVFDLGDFKTVCENDKNNTANLKKSAEALLEQTENAIKKLSENRDNILIQQELWLISGKKRSALKPVTEKERDGALDRYFSDLCEGALKEIRRWKNVEDLVKLKGHYRTLVKPNHVVGMFALADNEIKFEKLLQFLTEETEPKIALTNSRLFERAAKGQIGLSQTAQRNISQDLQTQAVGNVRKWSYGENSYFRKHPQIAQLIFSKNPELCRQLFYNQSDEFIQLLRSMQGKLNIKTFLRTQSSWLDGNMLLHIAPALVDILTKKGFDSYFGWGFGKTPRRLLKHAANKIATAFDSNDAAKKTAQGILLDAIANDAVFDTLDFSADQAITLATRAKSPVIDTAISKRDHYVGRIVSDAIKYSAFHHAPAEGKTAVHIAVDVKKKVKEHGGVFNRAKVFAEAFHKKNSTITFEPAEWRYIVESDSRLWKALSEPDFWATTFGRVKKEDWLTKLKKASPYCRAKLEGGSYPADSPVVNNDRASLLEVERRESALSQPDEENLSRTVVPGAQLFSQNPATKQNDNVELPNPNPAKLRFFVSASFPPPSIDVSRFVAPIPSSTALSLSKLTQAGNTDQPKRRSTLTHAQQTAVSILEGCDAFDNYLESNFDNSIEHLILREITAIKRGMAQWFLAEQQFLDAPFKEIIFNNISQAFECLAKRFNYPVDQLSYGAIWDKQLLANLQTYEELYESIQTLTNVFQKNHAFSVRIPEAKKYLEQAFGFLISIDLSLHDFEKAYYKEIITAQSRVVTDHSLEGHENNADSEDLNPQIQIDEKTGEAIVDSALPDPQIFVDENSEPENPDIQIRIDEETGKPIVDSTLSDRQIFVKENLEDENPGEQIPIDEKTGLPVVDSTRQDRQIFVDESQNPRRNTP